MPTPLHNLLTPRFSLRALLVVVTVGCLTLGWRANRYFQNRRVIDSFYKDGLGIHRSHEPGNDADLNLSFWSNVNIEQIGISRTAPDSQKRVTIWSDLSRLAPLKRISLYGIELPEQPPATPLTALHGVRESRISRLSFSRDLL
jgi:hypothetical protein